VTKYGKVFVLMNNDKGKPAIFLRGWYVAPNSVSFNFIATEIDEVLAGQN